MNKIKNSSLLAKFLNDKKSRIRCKFTYFLSTLPTIVYFGICLNSFIKKIIATVKAIKSVRGVA